MEGESRRIDLRSLVESIKASDALETQISLISQLGESYQSETCDLSFLVQHLTEFWADSTCLGTSQCMFNKKIVNIALKHLELVESNCLTQFLILSTKASVWCRKHLQMTLESNEEGNEKHSSIFFQLILDSLNLSSALITTLTRSPIIGEKVEMLIIENFVLEQLNLTKISILKIKKIHPTASEVLKEAQVVLDDMVKLCRSYSKVIKLDSNELDKRHEELVDTTGVDYAGHVISITTCTIENLYELGTFAASGGGNLVTVLNLSWKGVISLLQLFKGILSERINIGDIILTLVSLVADSLRCAAIAWSSCLTKVVTTSDAKRACLPIKFFLINAVRIFSEYPCQIMCIYMEIARCVLTISTLGIIWSNEAHLRPASEALVELVEPTSFLLLHTLLNSAGVKAEVKCLIIEWLFKDQMDSDPMHLEEGFDASGKLTSLDSIFSMNCDAVTGSDALLLGRIMIFLSLLKTSQALREEMVAAISKKLDWLMDFLMHEDVYSSILGLQIPVFSCSGSPEIVWQFMLPFTLHVLRTFMIVATTSIVAWKEMETFLFRNLLHTHFLCLEVVMDLWCFLIRHAEPELVLHMIDGLRSLLKTVASLESSLASLCPLRKMAKTLCVILTYAAPTIIDHVYSSIINDDDSYLSSVISIALFMEGFPLFSLSDNLKMLANQKICTEFRGFMEQHSKEYELKGCSSSIHSLPVYALSSVLLSCQLKDSCIIDENLISQAFKFALSLIRSYKHATEDMKESLAKLLSAILDIISNVKHGYVSDEVRAVILEMKTLLVSGPAVFDALSYQWKPSMASFLAKLCHMELAEGEENALCSALYHLFHVLLRERHWAFIHLAIAAFGYFAARTSCTELWRFVPRDAALSFDVGTGNEANEDRFMSELKAFLEKEVASNDVIPCKEQLRLLAVEGKMLRKNCMIMSTISQVSGSETPWAHNEDCVKTKRRKLQVPDGISEGMGLLLSGLKIMRDSLAEADSMELKEAFSTHISCLEDVISQMMNL